MAVNTHFDHIGEEARRQSALLIIKKIKEIVGERPAIVTGDFNVTDASSAYETITTNEFVMKDAYKIAGHVTGVDYTFHDFARIPPQNCEKIDFIFVTPQIKVTGCDIPAEIPGALLSDHNPSWLIWNSSRIPRRLHDSCHSRRTQSVQPPADIVPVSFLYIDYASHTAEQDLQESRRRAYLG